MHRQFSAFAAALIAAALLTSPAYAQSEEPPESGSAPRPSGPSVGSMEGPGGLYDKAAHERGPMLSFFGYLPYSYSLGIGVGGRFLIPLAKDGFIQDINDSVALELGADVAFGAYAFNAGTYTELSIVPVEGMWQFHFTPTLSAYGKLGLGYTLFFSSFTGIGAYANVFYYNLAFGGMFKLSEKLALRGELGYRGLKVGLGFEF